MHLSLRESLSIALPAALAAAAIAISGCGGGDDSSSTSSSTPLTQDDFVSQADAICADVRTQVSDIAPPTNQMESLAEYTASGLAILKPAQEQLQALTPPEDQRTKYEAYLAMVESQIQVEEALHDAEIAGDADAVKARVKELRSEETQQAAAGLGFTECAKGS
jgi:hypothetical protein